jgi:hypothetical protein
LRIYNKEYSLSSAGAFGSVRECEVKAGFWLLPESSREDTFLFLKKTQQGKITVVEKNNVTLFLLVHSQYRPKRLSFSLAGPRASTIWQPENQNGDE